MKKLSLPNKFIFLLNSIVGFALLISYALPFISPEKLPILAVLSLLAPLLIVINILFLIYWLVKFKKQFFLSFVILAIGYQQITSLYKIEDKKVLQEKDTKIMSYNVRLFNLYDWIKEDNVKTKIFDFISEKKPDIICFQEFDPKQKEEINFPYKYVKRRNEQSSFGQAIYSKYQIIKTGSLDFKNSSNNAIFADIVKDKDTLRVYNIHLESLKINPNKQNFGQATSDKLIGRLKNAFKKQAVQVHQILAHQKKCKYKIITCGDFNNTAFSWAYKQLKAAKNDAFEIAGQGFGSTFNYWAPLRIDFILVDSKIEVNHFKTYKVKYSDHFPIMARIAVH